MSETVPRSWIAIGRQFGFGALVLMAASGVGFAASTAAVSGVVRDAQGVAQMGAMVQVLAAGPVPVATAFTDISGRYRIANLLPGSYQVRATAALFVPATRRNLRLSNGMLATVNLTLNMLADPAAWLPAQRRRPDEPGDDWTWTLRSAANRPILRMLGDGEIVPVFADGAAPHSHVLARTAVLDGDGSFGESGVRSAVVLDRTNAAGSDFVLRASAAPPAFVAAAQPVEVDAGFQSAAAFSGSSRLVVSLASHPELRTGDGVAGMQLMRMAGARKMQLGDAIDVEAGGTVYAIHTSGTALSTRPFLRVTVHPGEVWAVRYRLATSRDVQGYDSLDSIATDLPVTAVSGGRMSIPGGHHQELSLSRRMGGGMIEAAVYRDVIDRSLLTGSGASAIADSGELVAEDASVDTNSGAFQLLGAGYSTTGVSFSVSEPLTPAVWAALDYQRGAALSAPKDGQAITAISQMQTATAQAVTAAISGKLDCSGTRVRASYRWQPEHLVTSVDPYAAQSDQDYLSFYVRQAVRWGNMLPQGLEATIDVTNLLAEGYTPFLSADGRTLFLAQTPRMVRGGLSFNF